MIAFVMIPHGRITRAGEIAAFVATMKSFNKHFRRDCLVVSVGSIGLFKYAGRVEILYMSAGERSEHNL